MNCLWSMPMPYKKEEDKKYSGTNASTLLGKHTHDVTQGIFFKIWSNKALNTELGRQSSALH